MLHVDLSAPVELRDAVAVLESLRAAADLTFGEFEAALIPALMGVGRALAKERMECTTPRAGFEENGTPWKVAVRSKLDVLTVCGRVVAERPLFRQERNGPTRDVLAERVGLVEGLWTPAAAKLGALAIAEMSYGRAEGFFAVAGIVGASKSSLLRLGCGLSQMWEEGREQHEHTVRMALTIPPEAKTVAVSLDGVMVMMVGSKRSAVRAAARREGRPDKGPAGFKEASVGVVAFYDGAGTRLSTRRYARMPEADKATTKAWLTAELKHIKEVRPDLVTMAMADGASNNWSFLNELGVDQELVDFFHTAEHLHRHVSKANGPSSVDTQEKLRDMRHKLLTVPGGAAEVFRDMQALRDDVVGHAANDPPRRGKGSRGQPTFFDMHHDRMDYAGAKAMGRPIGTGVTESTCKWAVCDRLRRTGMRWREAGGQAVLTLRAMQISGSFDHAWNELMNVNRQRLTAWAA